jgi:hypothetical protein
MFPQLARFTDLGLLLMRLMVGLVLGCGSEPRVAKLDGCRNVTVALPAELAYLISQ